MSEKEIKEVNKDVSKSFFKDKKEKIKEKVKSIDTEKIKEETKVKTEKAKEYYKNNTKKCLIWLVVIIFALAIINKVFKTVSSAISKEFTAKGLAVNVEEIKLESLNNEIVYPAKVEATDNVKVITKATGEVLEVCVKLGDWVNEGDVLFRIDPSDIRLSQAAASASLQAAQSAYQMQSNESGDASLNQARVQFESAERNYNAAVEIHEKGGISDVEFENAKAAYESAKAAYNGMTNGGAQAQRQASLAQLDAARVQYKQATDMLANCNVKAPISGIVGELNVKVHDMAQTGYSVVTIVNSNELEVKLNVSEQVVSQIGKGDIVDIKLNSYPNKTFSGVIDGVSDAANQSSVYPVVIKFNNEENNDEEKNEDDKKDEEEINIKSGMFGKVIFKTNKIDETIVIDNDCIIEEADEKYVFILGEKNKVKKVIVETGISNGRETEIISGLAVGDKVITKGQDYLDDGDSVRVVEG